MIKQNMWWIILVVILIGLLMWMTPEYENNTTTTKTRETDLRLDMYISYMSGCTEEDITRIHYCDCTYRVLVFELGEDLIIHELNKGYITPILERSVQYAFNICKGYR
jgi:hypothetical protein